MTVFPACPPVAAQIAAPRLCSCVARECARVTRAADLQQRWERSTLCSYWFCFLSDKYRQAIDVVSWSHRLQIQITKLPTVFPTKFRDLNTQVYQPTNLVFATGHVRLTRVHRCVTICFIIKIMKSRPTPPYRPVPPPDPPPADSRPGGRLACWVAMWLAGYKNG